MSMTTITKKNSMKKTGRWQAALLAGLVLAGSVAVPQAATAANKTQAHCGSASSTTCQLTTKANGAIHFRVTANVSRTKAMPYTVKTSSGRTLCSGTTKTGSLKICSFRYSGTVKVSVKTPYMAFPSITAY